MCVLDRSPLLPPDCLDVGHRRRSVGPATNSLSLLRLQKSRQLRLLPPLPLHHFCPPPLPPPPVELRCLGRLPSASHPVEPPLVDSSRLAYLRDLALPLPKVSLPESSFSTLPDESCTHRPPTTSGSHFPSPLVTGALLLCVPHARAVLVQLENQAQGISSSSSRLSAATPSATTEPSSTPVRTPFLASPSRFSCSGR
jgi:hypothetical protein